MIVSRRSRKAVPPQLLFDRLFIEKLTETLLTQVQIKGGKRWRNLKPLRNYKSK